MALYRMDPLEIAGGWLNGYDDEPVPAPAGSTPAEALDHGLLPLLSRSPCMIAFSGGRDSSVLLAAALRAARREGLPLPVPVTLTYPDAEGTDESGWQEQVLEHLGVRERVVLAVHDEHDPIGPVAEPVLRRHGVVWPPNFAPTSRLLGLARGGALLTGESGDEVFGLKRITPATKLLSTRGRTGRQVYRCAAAAMAPAPLRRRAALRHRYRRPWLHADVERALGARDAADAVAQSLHAGRNTWQMATRRCARRAYDTIRLLGDEAGVAYAQPFGEYGFVAAVARAAGVRGWSGRTATMRRLFGDLLPRAVLERRTKATFTHAVFTGRTREFARRWDGSGVDADLVDVEALRRNWLSEAPHAPSMVLLQQAWLAEAR